MLHVLMNGQIIGDLDGTAKNLRLRYEASAVPAPWFVPLSVNMPADRARWRGAKLDAWLDGLLPDRDAVIQRWRTQFGIRSRNTIDLLAYVGEDVAGSAQFVRPDRLDTVLHQDKALTPLSEAEIAAIARAARLDSLPYDRAAHVGHFSLAGAQAKFALQKTGSGWALPSGAEPSTHIFKPAIPGLDDQDVVEVITMRMAALLGLPTAFARLTNFGGESVAEVERYDRVLVNGSWHRIHQEDLCQALGIYPFQKYESQGGPTALACVDVIRKFCGEQDVRTFVRSLIFNYAVRGSDAHARNYALLITPGDVRLAPLYDLNTTLSFGDRWAAHLAMSIGGEDRLDTITTSHWTLFAEQAGLESDWIHDELVAFLANTPDALTTVCDSEDLANETHRMRERLQTASALWCNEARRATTR